jgi:predicted DNA-binding transcriptional regulator AlpA
MSITTLLKGFPMIQVNAATVEQTSSPNSRPMPPGRMLIDVRTVAAKYGADERSIFRWADAGKIPFGIKLSALRRWDVVEIDAHIANGCKPIRTVTDKAVRA